MNNKNTIIGFDSWTNGAPNFERLVQEFKKNGYRLILIHIGSWGHDTNRPIEEMIGELAVRDISYYGKKTFNEIIEIEDPAAILFLSTRAFAHMAFNRCARYMNIPTCHLYHGLVTVQAVSPGETAYKLNCSQHFRNLISRAWKNIFRLIPCYIRSLVYTKAPAVTWLHLLREIAGKAFHGAAKKVPIDATTKIGCVYVNADTLHMARNYGVPISKISVVGNPDLIKFGLNEEDICYFYSNSYTPDNSIIYIDTGLSKSGVVFDSDSDFIRHIVETSSALGLLGYTLSVKLHPAHYQSCVPQELKKHGVKICSNQEFIPQLKLSRAVIVEPSSAAIIPAIIGLPIFLAKYGKLRAQAYGEVLTTYPRANPLESIDEIQTVLCGEKMEKTSAVEVFGWVEKNVGPLPASDMPARVVEAINQTIWEERA